MRTSFKFLSQILMATLINICWPSFSGALEHFTVGWVPNQIHYDQGSLLVINSGVNSGISQAPSVSKIVLHNQTVSTVTLPMATNPYRGTLIDGWLWLTYNLTDEIVRAPLADLPGATAVTPQVLYQPDLNSTGAESILAVGNRVWVAFSNLNADLTFGKGEIFILNKTDGQPETRLSFAEKNPKFFHKLENGKMAVAFGDYESHSGSIAVLDPTMMENLPATTDVSAQTPLPFAKYFSVGGTPGAVTSYQSEMWSCDQFLEGPSNAYKIDLQSGNQQSYQLPFPACSAIGASAKYIYILSLYGGLENIRKEHLFVYDRENFILKCALEVIPPRFHSPMLGFPTDLLLFQNESKNYLAIAMSSINTVSVLNLDQSAWPEDCGPAR